MNIKVTKDKANGALEKLNHIGEVSFDSTYGTFSVGGVEGRFEYDENSEMLTVVIDDTPFFVSEDYCYEQIKKYFI